jgi:hypothetical protein
MKCSRKSLDSIGFCYFAKEILWIWYGGDFDPNIVFNYRLCLGQNFGDPSGYAFCCGVSVRFSPSRQKT